MEMLPPPTPDTPPSVDGIRELTAEEIQSVEHIFRAAGTSLPDPSISTFVGAVKAGKVIGFIVLQLKLHAEPMWIEDGNSSIFQSLVKAAERVIITRTGPQWVYLFTPAGKITQLAQAMGCQLEPWCVMSKLVAPELPGKPIPFLADTPVEGAVQ